MKVLSLLVVLVFPIAQGSWAKTVVVGGAGGALSYPNAQTSLGISAGDTIVIQPGSYTGFDFGNLRGTALDKIVITNGKGLVEISNPCASCSSDLNNAVNVVFTGFGDSGIEYGFSFHDIGYRALQLDGHMDSTTISHCRFENVVDNAIQMNNASMVYDGTPGTLISGMKFLHLYAKNTGTVVDWGNYAGAADQMGVGRDIEIAYDTVDSCQGGQAFRLNKVYDANVHHNTITNMGLGLTTSHPGIVFLRGDGKIHHNYVRNVWGVCARGFGSGLNGTGELDVYDNIFLSSRKYSAVEAQTFSADISTDTTTIPWVGICNYLVYNNTMGNQSAADFTAAMVDVYTLVGGKCEIRNNLGFNIAKDKPYDPTVNYVYNLESPNPPDTSNNIYRPNFVDEGLVDTVDCFLRPGSIAIDHGATLPLVTDDFAGVPRPQGAAPDVGAREYDLTAAVQSRPLSRGARLTMDPDHRSLLVRSDFPIRSVSVWSATGHRASTNTSTGGDLELHIPLDGLDPGTYVAIIHGSDRVESRTFVRF
jgi:hypothetical protein